MLNSIKLLKASAFNPWTKTHEWLVITECKIMLYKIQFAQTEKFLPKNLLSQKGFINGGVNFKSFALKEYAAFDCHKTGLEEITMKSQSKLITSESLLPKHDINTKNSKKHKE